MYKTHRFDINMSRDQQRLDQFLNSLSGEVVSIIPNISIWFFWIHRINFLLIVEKTDDQ